MTWTTLDTLLAASIVLAIAAGSCGCLSERRCHWESPYPNTLQHDIHRELVCP